VHQQTINGIVAELSAALVERSLGKIFQLSPFSLALDFRERDGRYLFVSADPSLPRIYLISRRTRDLEKQSGPLSAFGQALRANLGGGKLVSIKKDPGERIVRLDFKVQDETGEFDDRALIAQLTGRSANLLLLDDQDRITHALRPLKGKDQQVGERFEAPQARPGSPVHELPLEQGSFASLSAAADDFYRQLEATRALDARANEARARLRNEATRLRKLERHLKEDLAAHGDAETHKRLGDLLLANIANARRRGNVVKLRDFYADGAPLIEIEVDEHSTLQDEAARYFARYTKAKTAIREITRRLGQLQKVSAELARRQANLETIIAARDEVALAAFDEKAHGKKPSRADSTKKKKREEKIAGVRRYLSSDGYEILVGRAARDNDQLTFRVARPHDLWLHAADYPGSHVIVRNSSRKEIPHRTVIEAAQLAAKFSQASKDPKVSVHYTQRKFVSRIKGGAPGLVRLSSFKTMTVEPKESVERI
jgi:predicted ribosome quality control (RQC) complex YloA/Tae2 family protein